MVVERPGDDATGVCTGTRPVRERKTARCRGGGRQEGVQAGLPGW